MTKLRTKVDVGSFEIGDECEVRISNPEHIDHPQYKKTYTPITNMIRMNSIGKLHWEYSDGTTMPAVANNTLPGNAWEWYQQMRLLQEQHQSERYRLYSTMVLATGEVHIKVVSDFTVCTDQLDQFNCKLKGFEMVMCHECPSENDEDMTDIEMTAYLLKMDEQMLQETVDMFLEQTETVWTLFGVGVAL